MLKVYNTLSRKKEEFIPQEKNKVRMYVCGITPYDECHVGHARCYVVFDVVHRYLRYKGYRVHYMQNFTDIDDKIINKAKEELKINISPPVLKEKIREIADRYIASYINYMKKLNVKDADEYPRVTEHIDDIIKTIESLKDKDCAYLEDKPLTKDAANILWGVYFDLDNYEKKGYDYGRLSHHIFQEKPGWIEDADTRKKNLFDFALWKAAKEGEPSWDSPWGKGRPGWHIECSVMSMKLMNPQNDYILDIHGGGQDLIFPHHENEIAQSKAATGKELAKYWIHNGFITINKEKMSKSLGNFFTIREVLEKYDPMVLRLFLLSAHYRQPMDFSDKELDASRETLERMRIFKNNLNFIFASTGIKIKESESEITNSQLLELKKRFEEAMDDDFNTPKALGYIHELITQANIVRNKIAHSKTFQKEAIEFLKEAKILFAQLTGVLGLKIETKTSPDEFSSLIAEREKARKNKDWTTADRIREQLREKGIVIEDTSFGPHPVLKE